MDENDPYGWYLDDGRGDDADDWLDEEARQFQSQEIYDRSLQPEQYPELPALASAADTDAEQLLKRNRDQAPADPHISEPQRSDKRQRT